jgi:hypothetical protein
MLGNPRVVSRLDGLLEGRAAVGGPASAAGPALGLSPERAAKLVHQLVLDNDLHPHTGEPMNFDSLEVLVMRVRCVDETNGFGGSELGSDEIELGGFGIGPAVAPRVAHIPRTVLGDYDDGTVRTYSPPVGLALLPLGNDTEYPKRFFVTLLLVESDGGDFTAFLTDVIDEVQKFLDSNWVEIAAFLAAGVAGAVYAYLYTWIASKILSIISWLWTDDHFPEQAFEIAVQSPDGPSNGGEYTVRFTGPGEYLVRIGCALTNAPRHPHHDPKTPPGGQTP